MRTSSSESSRVHVGVAELAVTDGGTRLETSGLGSCVAVVAYDERAESAVGGLLHAMLPSVEEASSRRRTVVAKYVDSGIDELVSRLDTAGVPRANLVAKMVGGSDMLGVAIDDPVGGRNVAAARDHLARLEVPILGEDVGGNHGRSVRFDPATGDVSVRRAHGDERRL